MYKVRNVTREFKVKGSRTKLQALKNINLDFPNKGLVFVTGRSGSGKSTFLNILGGLDKPSKGDVFFNDTKISKLHEYKLAKYRNLNIGFVFQDFCLMENMTVYENVSLALELKREKNKEYIDEILKELRIFELKNCKVNRLSAGQKQRVSIARAIVKKPKVILADEPTGNLDPSSSEIILHFLQKISSETLVILISHNLSDAYKYADRIITLEKGEVIHDLTSDIAERKIIKKDGVLYLNDIKDLSKKEINKLNKEIESNDIKEVRPIYDVFKKTKKVDYKHIDDNLFEKKYISSFNLLKLFHNFLGKQTVRTTLYALISMIIICLMSLCQMFISFDSSIVLEDIVRDSNTDNVVLVKYDETRKVTSFTNEGTNYILKLNENELDDLDHENLLYNFNIPISSNAFLYDGKVTGIKNYFTSSIYTKYCNGVILTSERYLKKSFNLSSDDELFAIKNSEIKNYGIYLTDYLADAILLYKKYTSYESLMGYYN